MSVPLPTEILNLILELLSDDTVALKACSLVSTAWHTSAATILFSYLELLCSINQPDPPPKRKRQFKALFGVLPVSRKTPSVRDPDPHCICKFYEDRSVQRFHSNGASFAHITRNVVRLRLMFCRSSHDADHSPHSLQLYPDSVIHPLLQLADELSFVHLRSLTIDSGPQVLYFLGSEPFGGIISSAAACLEDITFCGHNSMRNSDIKRMLNQHSFSCVRFPCLRRISFQGLFELGVTNGRRMWCTLDLTRNLYDGTPSVSVCVSYAFFPDLSKGSFLNFKLADRCCFSGLCYQLRALKIQSLAELMSLGTGVIDWSLPTLGIVLQALQSDSLTHLTPVLEVKISDIADASGTKLLPYLTSNFPQISSLTLCFTKLNDLMKFLLDMTESDQLRPTILPHLSLFSHLRSLNLIVSHNSTLMFVFDYQTFFPKEVPSISMIPLDRIFIPQNAPSNSELNSLFQRSQEEIISALDVLFVELWLLTKSRKSLPYLQEVVLEVRLDKAEMQWLSDHLNVPIPAMLSHSDLEKMFRKTRETVESGFFTIR